MNSRLFLGSLISCGIFASSAALAASPEAPPTQPVKAVDSSEHLRGMELMIRPAFGAPPSDSPVRVQVANAPVADWGSLLQGGSPYGVGFVGQASLGYRFHPVVSGGLRGGFRTVSISELKDGTTGLSRSAWDAGFYVRGYVLGWEESLRKYIDPWISVGVEYMSDVQTYKRPVATTAGTLVGDWKFDHHAVAVPIGIGADYRLHPMFSVGPSFEYTIAAPVAGCAGVSAPGALPQKFCSSDNTGEKFIQANSYGVWSLGIDLKVTLF